MAKRRSGARHDHRSMERLLRKRKRAGLTYVELADSSGVPLSTLTWWSRKLGLTKTRRKPRERAGPVFVEAEVVRGDGAPQRNAARYQIETPTGYRISTEGSFDLESVRGLLKLVRERC